MVVIANLDAFLHKAKSLTALPNDSFRVVIFALTWIAITHALEVGAAYCPLIIVAMFNVDQITEDGLGANIGPPSLQLVNRDWLLLEPGVR